MKESSVSSNTTVRYQPYRQSPSTTSSKQFLEELTNGYPNVDLSQHPIKENMGEVLQILFAMVMYETLNSEGGTKSVSTPLAAENYHHHSTTPHSTPHLNISNFKREDEINKQFSPAPSKSCSSTTSIVVNSTEINPTCTVTTTTNTEQCSAIVSTTTDPHCFSGSNPSPSTVKASKSSEVRPNESDCNNSFK